MNIVIFHSDVKVPAGTYIYIYCITAFILIVKRNELYRIMLIQSLQDKFTGQSKVQADVKKCAPPVMSSFGFTTLDNDETL